MNEIRCLDSSVWVRPVMKILFFLSVILVVAGATPHPAVLDACGDTLYPELCVSTIDLAAAGGAAAVRSNKDVLKALLNYTIYTVERNYFTIKKVAARSSLTPREKVALHDCLEVIADTLAEVHTCEDDTKDYGLKNYSIAEHKEKLLTLLSAAQTNQETCLDGFSEDDADRKVRKLLIAGQIHVFRLVSNVMAVIAKISGNETAVTRRPGNEDWSSPESDWPKWVSAGDRKLLQATTVTADVTVAADGSGNFRSIAAAVAAAPSRSSRRYVIRIRAGTYRENIDIPRSRTNLFFVGDGQSNTIITGSRSVAGGSTTFRSATVAVNGDGFLARDITFQNTAGPGGHQAVALRVSADLAAFYRCNFVAYQDTLYVHSLRQFYSNCYIAGTVDFIFGNAAALIQNSNIQARRPNANQRNMITAQGRDDPNQNTGIVIQRSRISAASDLQPVIGSFPTYLGRPWREYSRTVIMQTDISNVIRPEGWHEWSGNFALNTLFYAEYANTGAGAATANRVRWGGFRVLTTAAQAQPFTANNFISASNWVPATGFPFQTGL